MYNVQRTMNLFAADVSLSQDTFSQVLSKSER
jgi:hypothetical protein